MPFKSEAQRRFMFARHPDIARRFEAETPRDADLPQHVSGDDRTRVREEVMRRQAARRGGERR